jgi:hypothetical protein
VISEKAPARAMKWKQELEKHLPLRSTQSVMYVQGDELDDELDDESWEDVAMKITTEAELEAEAENMEQNSDEEEW